MGRLVRQGPLQHQRERQADDDARLAYVNAGGASPWGALDMAGNVWEWTSSLYTPYPYSASDGREDPNSTENRALRGGSWSYDARLARAAYRAVVGPAGFIGVYGFRLVLSAVSANVKSSSPQPPSPCGGKGS